MESKHRLDTIWIQTSNLLLGLLQGKTFIKSTKKDEIWREKEKTLSCSVSLFGFYQFYSSLPIPLNLSQLFSLSLSLPLSPPLDLCLKSLFIRMYFWILIKVNCIIFYTFVRNKCRKTRGGESKRGKYEYWNVHYGLEVEEVVLKLSNNLIHPFIFMVFSLSLSRVVSHFFASFFFFSVFFL